MNKLGIPIEAVDCHPAPPRIMRINWDRLLWAAITVGRPNRHYVFQHGQSSLYEAVFRASMLRMAVEVSPGRGRYQRTGAFKSLDPSEKGAINYFLGLTLCKAFADKVLNVPWLLHLDVFDRALNPKLKDMGRSRPDLVGRRPDGSWIAFEAKGRASPTSSETKANAKTQAERIVSVQGRRVSGHYAGISYFNKDTLSFYVQDPTPLTPDDPLALELEAKDESLMEAYYQPFVSMLEPAGRDLGSRFEPKLNDEVVRLRFDEMDLEIGIHRKVLEMARERMWIELVRFLNSERHVFPHNGIRGDGISIKCGETWRRAGFTRGEDE